MTIQETEQTRPVLATPSQILAEDTLLEILEDARLKRLRAELRDQLAATPRGQSPSGAATLDEAISQWSNSLIMAETANFLPAPSQLWVTDDTPREWLGHTLPGVGTSGDNPDAIYRIASVDGARRFEVLGRFDPDRRPAQLNIELHRGTKVTPPHMVNNTDLTPLASITDRHLQIAADGSFRITIGPKEESPVHLLSAPGLLSLGSRDMLADWNQRPSWMDLRPLDDQESAPFDIAAVKQAVYRDLPNYLLFWANFPNVWFGGLQGNRISPGHTRTGSMAGFTVALSWNLRPGEAIAVTTDPVGAAYTGFQLMDPWMIGANAKEHQVSLNLAQTMPNPDGTFTFVLAHEDPGVANWLDTTGLAEGLGLIRWQATPPGASIDPAALVRDFQVIPLTALDSLDLPRVNPEQRAAQLAARAAEYHSRTL
ncbi:MULTISPECIES: hypothetical protein [Pseudofrankia]|uniref:hypothetical protein n=1 Tax=Pseudofrankia TaxID=2994363 RepID=UPI000234D103|nr:MULTISPECIES: hypothetical protein [Pseudofrankia]OHV27924.1 hypothetical protein BCD49_38525 [Pseudofrankia sp. EUN1h]